MQKYDHVNRADITGKTTQQALEILCDKLNDTMVLVMLLNNEIMDLKSQIERLRQ